MKGVINRGIQEYVIAAHGPDVWDRIKARAGCEEFVFAPSNDYPDELTSRLMQATSQVSGIPLDTVQVEYGQFMVPNTLKETYAPYFRIAGNTPREFLLKLDEIHRHVTQRLINARPPRLECIELSHRQLLIHYYSVRKLCPVLRGLIQGVGIHLGQDLRVRETTCMHNGYPCCTMEITLL